MHHVHSLRPTLGSRAVSLAFFVLTLSAPDARALAQDAVDVPTITLTRVLRAAQRDPPAVAVAYAQLMQAQAERSYAKGAWYPSLVGEASAGYTYDNRRVLP